MDNGYKEDIAKLLKETDKIDFRIRTLNDDNENLTAQNDKDIEEYQEDKRKVEFELKEIFAKTGEDKIQTKMGFTAWKVLNDKLIYTDKTIDEIEKKYPGEAEDYIKTSKSLKLDPLKKAIENGSIVLTEMDRLIQKKKFVYKYTGGNK